MHYALNIVSIIVYKPKVGLPKTVLFSLNIICKAIPGKIIQVNDNVINSYFQW